MKLEKLTSIADILLNLSRPKKRYIAIASDVLFLVTSVIFSFFLRIGHFSGFADEVFSVSLIAILIWLPVAWATGVYNAIFRYAGLGTMLALVRAIIIYVIPFSLIYMAYTMPGVPRTIGLIQPIIFFLTLALNRIVMRYLLVDIFHSARFKGAIRRVIIYGGGSSGRQLAGSLRQEPGFQIVGFVDDDVRLDGQLLDGVRVHDVSKLASVIGKSGATDIILAMPRNSKAKNREIMKKLEAFEIRVKTLPPIGELVDHGIDASIVRDINVEDLLGRDAVPPDRELMSQTIEGKTVLVTGAGGSIGSELCAQILRLRPNRLILVEMAEFSLYQVEQLLVGSNEFANFSESIEVIPELANISDMAVVDRLFNKWRPNTVFHAAAYKHVPLVEHNPIGGMRNNIFGTYYCALSAEKYGADSFTLVSTDKAVRPTNIMGATKRVCELILQALSADGSATKFSMVRFGNVLGSSGSVVPRFEKQIREGGPVTLTDRRITRYFMTIPEAAQLVIQAGALANSGEVCVLDMGKAIRIIDLATAMIKLSGLTEKNSFNVDGDIEIIEVGLRPGEKLYEELLIGNNPQPTVHPRIFKANESYLKKNELEIELERLWRYLLNGDAPEAVKILKGLVPEYVPQA